MNPIMLHINYCELAFHKLGKSVDEVCKKAMDWGYDGIEFRGSLPIDYTCSVDEYIAQVKAAKDKYHVPKIMYGYGVKGVSSDDKAVREKAVADAIDFFTKVREATNTTICNTFSDEIINPQGGGNYNFNGSHFATEDQWNRTVEGFQKVGAACEKIGMKLAFETHMNFVHDVPKSCKKLVDEINSPVVGLNMDYGNTIYFINVPTPAETVALYGDTLFYMHLKNSIGMGDSRYPTALAEGEINHRLYLKAVADSGYKGPIGIEAPRGGDREWFARQDIAYFKAVAEEIGLR